MRMGGIIAVEEGDLVLIVDGEDGDLLVIVLRGG